jgi:ketosteroid isomerase-like protein
VLGDPSDLINRSYKAFRDDDLTTLLTLYHPEAVWDFTHWEEFPDAPIYRGLAGVEEVLRMLRDVFGEFDIHPVEIVEVGENRMFVKARITIRGKASGIEVDAPPYAQIVEFRDGLTALVQNYSDVDAARRAAGLTQ